MKQVLLAVVLTLSACVKPEISVCNVANACQISVCSQGNTCIAKPLELKGPLP